ncbi:MAG: hypothetical protein NTW87_05430 [Planctomycetota bacterium]|nr:hypothetical protein [Planctomycetota bacterium]
MAIPTDYLKKRDLLHSEKTPRATLSKVGWEFFNLERFSDALDFFEKARDEQGILKTKRTALERGDVFLLARLERFDRSLVSREEWEAAAKRAAETGRQSMALFVAKKFAPPPEAAAAAAAPAELPGETPLSEV